MRAGDHDPGGSPNLGRSYALAVALGLVLRTGLAMAPVAWLDLRFVPDDTYYILSIARSIAEGHGPTADGVTLTNGFQPLIVFLLTPVLALLGDGDLALRALWLGCALVDTGNVALAGRLAHRLGGPRAGTLAAVIWATSPLALRMALGGMETSLAIFCSLALVNLWCHARARQTPTSWIAVGLLCGLTLLSRVDTGALVGLLGMMELLRGSRRGVVVAAGVALLVVAPWWVWSWSHVGSVFPESGAAVRQLAFMYQGPDAQHTAALWAAGNLLPGPSFDLGASRPLFLLPVLGPLLLAITVLIGALGLLSLWRGPRSHADTPILGLMAYAALLPVLYVALVPAVWFFARYLAPTTMAVAIGSGVLFARSTAVAAFARTALPIMGLASFSAWYGPSFRMEEVAAIEATSGYLVGMRAAVEHLPPGAVVGSMQSGGLSWVAPDGVRVVNLDGVVDRSAFLAIAERRLDRVLRERGVTHFVDWDFQKDLLLEHAASDLELRPTWTWEVPMCSGHRLTLWEVHGAP